MFRKVIKALLLAGLSYFYLQSVGSNSKGWIDAVLLDTVNWLVLVAILYLASDYINALGVACVIVAALGIFIQGYIFYTIQFPSTQIEKTVEKPKDCWSENTSWYQRLSGRCYQ